jgi:hypothetical protein
MRSLIIIAILSIFSVKSFAQASVVVDVERNLHLQSLLDQRAVAMTSEKLMQSGLLEMELLDKLKMSADFLQTLHSLRILYGLVQQLVCQIDGLYIAMSHYRFDDNCVFRMKMEVAFLKLDLTTEVLDMAGSSGSIFSNKFSSSERVGMMNKISQTIMDTSKLLEDLKTLINRQNTVYLNSAGTKLRTNNHLSSWNLNRYR